ncbi:MAG TPA: PhoH family protein [Pseudomonadales bacterium]|nr:PhoH family protein [Pseudomonadales bacterium]
MKTDNVTQPASQSLTLAIEPADTRRLASLCGELNQHLKQIEQRLQVQIGQRGNIFTVVGSEQSAASALALLQQLYAETQGKQDLTPALIHLHLQNANLDSLVVPAAPADSAPLSIRTKKGSVKPRGAMQNTYVRAIQRHDINFGIGPAGTGKTYLAVACAVEALQSDRVERLLLVRPAVEAGEKLGFLPGDLAQKIDPYLRPLYDALYEMIGFEAVAKLLERQIIEIAPLAYMRGRTLNNAFIILDESQNTTTAQMKMFLTRIGFGSTAVITGDSTQIDLPRGVRSGLLHACEVLDGVDGISFTRFSSRDVVRHPLVQRIVDAYDKHENGDT